VVAVLGSGRPRRPLRGDRRHDRVPREDLVERERGVDRRHARAMAERPAERDVALSLGGELRPVRGDRRIEVEQPSLDETQRAGGRDALGRREHERRRVFRPRPLLVAVRQAAPQVDDHAAARVDAAGGADVGSGGEILGERVANPGEARIDAALDASQWRRHAGAG
jgi:hypothetical protein